MEPGEDEFWDLEEDEFDSPEAEGEYEEADAVAERINQMAQDLGEDEQLDWMPFFSANALIQTTSI